MKDSSWCKQWSLHAPTSSSGDPCGMRVRRNLPKRSTFCFNLSSSRSEMASNLGGCGDLAAVNHARNWESASVSSQNSVTCLALMWFALLLLMARDICVVLSGSADSEDNVNIASIMFPLILNFPPMKACIPSNFLSSMVVHNALGGECRRARSRQRTCRSTW